MAIKSIWRYTEDWGDLKYSTMPIPEFSIAILALTLTTLVTSLSLSQLKKRKQAYRG
ncbi:MAG: hypothetical protein QW589_03305 [Candidatus Bathyarchaeia archaeon]